MEILRAAAIRSLSNGYRPVMFEFRILGPLEVIGEDGPLRLGGPKQRATLAILLLSANRVVSVDRLADELYAGAAPVTAVTQVQRQISGLRKLLGSGSAIETRPPGYIIHLSPNQLDLDRFERGTDEAGRAMQRGDAIQAASLLRRVLGLWRGAALADLAHERFARIAVERLEEIRLAALEQRLDADLVLGRHRELIGELEELASRYPLRERLAGQLMLSLYRSSRQAEALDVYRRTREALVGGLGLEPTPALGELERAILTHDPALDLEQAGLAGAAPVLQERAVLVLPSGENRLEDLLAIAEPLALRRGHELIVTQLVASEAELDGALAAMKARRTSLSVPARTAAFTTGDRAADAVRLATTYDVDLVLIDAPDGLDAPMLPEELATTIERSPADLGVLAGSFEPARGSGVLIPFGGGEHDWGALEVGAWLSLATGETLTLVGTKADLRRGRRDASRLLADASLAAQRVLGVDIEPILAEPTDDGLVAAVEAARLVVVGISVRWPQEGIGASRRTLVRDARPPILLVHRGPRPGGLAPRQNRTHFTWSVDRGD